MHPEYPYRGRYSVKVFLEAPMIWRNVCIGMVAGWALGCEETGELNDVVICDAAKENDEARWVAVSMHQSGELALAARALWLMAQTPNVRADLEAKHCDWELDRREAAAEHYYDSVREGRLLAAE
jgi:hypothetical protein